MNHHSQPKTALILDASARLEVTVAVELCVVKAAGPNILEGESLEFDDLEVAWGRARAVQAVAEEDVDEQAVCVDVGWVPVCLEGVDRGPPE